MASAYSGPQNIMVRRCRKQYQAEGHWERQAEYQVERFSYHFVEFRIFAIGQKIGASRKQHGAYGGEHRESDMRNLRARGKESYLLVARHESQHYGIQVNVYADYQIEDK